MSEPTLLQWRTFVSAARRGSLSAAAIDLDLTQSAVSQSLRSLEALLGTTLLLRYGRGVRLSDAGARLLPMAEALLAQQTALLDIARGVAGVHGRVRVAAFPSLARHLLPGALSLLRQRHPALHLELDDVHHFGRTSVIDAVRSGRADLGLTQLLSGMGLTAHVLGEDPYELIAPREWLADRALHTIWSRPYIHLGDGHDSWVQQTLARHGAVLHSGLFLSSEVAITALVERGLGFTLLPRMTIPPLPDGVVRHALPWPLSRSYGTVTRPGPVGSAVQAVLDSLHEIEENAER